MNHPETDNIVARVLSGEIDAYEDIVRSYQQEVWKVVAAMLFNAQRTEDLVQQTFINAYQHLHHYQPGRDFAAWLKEIARNQVRQELRRRAREDRHLVLYQTNLLQTYDAPSATTAEAGLEEALRHCTQNLPPASAQMVALRYQSGRNFGEIAALLGRTVEATLRLRDDRVFGGRLGVVDQPLQRAGQWG
jgi:RNA polymerase sigma factor (sigma-70 family)